MKTFNTPRSFFLMTNDFYWFLLRRTLDMACEGLCPLASYGRKSLVTLLKELMWGKRGVLGSNLSPSTGGLWLTKALVHDCPFFTEKVTFSWNNEKQFVRFFILFMLVLIEKYHRKGWIFKCPYILNKWSSN